MDPAEEKLVEVSFSPGQVRQPGLWVKNGKNGGKNGDIAVS